MRPGESKGDAWVRGSCRPESDGSVDRERVCSRSCFSARCLGLPSNRSCGFSRGLSAKLRGFLIFPSLAVLASKPSPKLKEIERLRLPSENNRHCSVFGSSIDSELRAAREAPPATGREPSQSTGHPLDCQPWPCLAGTLDEMAHSTRGHPIAAIGLEEIGIADRTQPMLGPYLMAINPASGQNPGRKPR